MYIPITPNDLITVNYLANLRLNYEYRRIGYNYEQISQVSFHINNFFGSNLITTPSNITIGILAELLIYRNLTHYLYSKSSNIIKECFQYNLTIGGL